MKARDGYRVLFDGYNANPESMTALFKSIEQVECKGKKVAVLGDMLELGKNTKRFHEKLGEEAAKVGFSDIWYVGDQGKSFKVGLDIGGFSKNHYISDTYKESLALELASVLEEEDFVAIKGSRLVGLERLSEALGCREISTGD